MSIALGLVALTLAAYFPSLSGDFLWDDDVHVLDKAHLPGWEGLRRLWLEPGTSQEFYPLLHSAFWLQFRLWGAEPFGYHLVNTLLHGLNAVLVWCLLDRMRIPGALLAAAVFAVHPVHVESVAWISELKNVLSGSFFFMALLGYLRFRPIHPLTPEDRSMGSRSTGWYALSLFTFALALLSKTVTCTLPAVILLLLWCKKGKIGFVDVVPLLPMFLLGALAGASTVWVETELLGARGSTWDLTWTEAILVGGRALWFYAGKLVWPSDLTFIYPRFGIDTSSPGQYVYAVGFVLVVLGLFAARRRIGRAPLVAVLYFAGTLAPALGFFNVYFFVYSFVADHFQYLSSLGLIALAAALATRAVSARLSRHVRVCSGSGVVVLLATLSWNQSKIYTNNEVLWRDTLAKNPSAAIAHTNLANLLYARGEAHSAIPHYQNATELVEDADYEANLANALHGVRRTDEALVHYARAVAIAPSHAYSFHNWGCALVDVGRSEEALPLFVRTLELQPDAAKAHFNWAIALELLSRPADAIAHYEKAVGLHRENSAEGDVIATDLASNTMRAIELPKTLYLWGTALWRAGRPEEAVERYRDAIREDPRYAKAHQALSDLLTQMGDVEGAATHRAAAEALASGAPR